MKMNHLNETQVSIAADSCGENAVDNNRSQSRFCDRKYLSINSKIPFKKPRFPERNSFTLCKLFQRGACHFGENCRYVHNVSEIGNLGLKSVVEDEHLNGNRQRSDVCRVRECRFAYNGLDCPYGEKCMYLHKRDQNAGGDLGPNRENHAINVVDGRRYGSGGGEIESKSLIACQFYPKSAFYKCRLCVKFEMFGSCSYGEQCTYAHGKAELKGRGYYSKLEGDHACRSTPDDVQPNNAASCTANELRVEGRRAFMNRNIKNISEIYADWL